MTRNEIVHSLLLLEKFPAVPVRKNERRIRVSKTQGFSGPPDGEEPTLRISPPKEPHPRIIVLDDTGNRFRRHRKHWPVALETENDENSIVVYKLHRPIPAPPAPPSSGSDNGKKQEPRKDDLWHTVALHYPTQRVVIISVDDLRSDDVSISRGLSWERTALDVIWQLLHADKFQELRDCPHLIIRMGSDGAVYWRNNCKGKPAYEAWLIYDPLGIEGSGARQYGGEMVGYGSAFTAGFVGCLAKRCETNNSPAAEFLFQSSQGNNNGPDSKEVENGDSETDAGDPNSEGDDQENEEGRAKSGAINANSKTDDELPSMIDCIIAGLRTSRRLLAYGFGDEKQSPNYPIKQLFTEPTAEEKASSKVFTIEDTNFACNSIPIIPQSDVPDRSYWRLLDSIFHKKSDLLHIAVRLTATGAKPRSDDGQEQEAARLLKQVPLAVFAKKLRTYDRHEIEHYRALYSLMLDYIKKTNPPRPLSVAVFGPPGAGKSFGVKMVAKALAQSSRSRPIETLTFNLSQYQNSEQLASAFHLVRDLVLQGKVPLVFFDEFDTTLSGTQKGWLRYFLAPMQDAEFIDDGTPHPIGQAIFVFAGGTSSSYVEFAQPFLTPKDEQDAANFKAVKGPDFLSRLRGTLDIPGLDLDADFDAYGPVEAYPCEAAILLRRAGILAHQLSEKAPGLRDSSGTLQVSPAVLRTLLHVPRFVHGNRSFEALLDMSRLAGATKLHPSLLPSASHVNLHASATHLGQLVSTHYPFTPQQREQVAKSIHASYQEAEGENSKKDAAKDWPELKDVYRLSNMEQADHVAIKLRSVGLWFRKRTSGARDAQSKAILEENMEQLAMLEHDRWVAEKRRDGWIAASGIDSRCRDDHLLLHNCIFPWDELTEDLKNQDRATVREIPKHLAAAGLEVYKP